VAAGTFVSNLDALEAQREADPNLEHETPIEELFEDQLACADLVLLTKVDLVDAQTQTKVQDWLRQQLPQGVKVVPCRDGDINPELLLGFNAAVEDNLDARPSHHDTEEDHEHDDDINSVHLILDQAFDPKDLTAKLKQLVQEQEIYRIKGFVDVPNKPMRMVVQGVGSRLEHFFDRPWQASEPRQTRLVLIGRALVHSQIEGVLRSL
jgi:cobalamin biosynthesis protein CobW